MTKPDDIDQDAWEKAIEVDCGFLTGHRGLYVEDIARAIMSARAEEREAILQFEFDLPATATHPSGPAYASGWTDCFVAIRNYIRNRP